MRRSVLRRAAGLLEGVFAAGPGHLRGDDVVRMTMGNRIGFHNLNRKTGNRLRTRELNLSRTVQGAAPSIDLAVRGRRVVHGRGTAVADRAIFRFDCHRPALSRASLGTEEQRGRGAVPRQFITERRVL